MWLHIALVPNVDMLEDCMVSLKGKEKRPGKNLGVCSCLGFLLNRHQNMSTEGMLQCWQYSNTFSTFCAHAHYIKQVYNTQLIALNKLCRMTSISLRIFVFLTTVNLSQTYLCKTWEYYYNEDSESVDYRKGSG